MLQFIKLSMLSPKGTTIVAGSQVERKLLKEYYARMGCRIQNVAFGDVKYAIRVVPPHENSIKGRKS